MPLPEFLSLVTAALVDELKQPSMGADGDLRQFMLGLPVTALRVGTVPFADDMSDHARENLQGLVARHLYDQLMKLGVGGNRPGWIVNQRPAPLHHLLSPSDLRARP